MLKREEQNNQNKNGMIRPQSGKARSQTTTTAAALIKNAQTTAMNNKTRQSNDNNVFSPQKNQQLLNNSQFMNKQMEFQNPQDIRRERYLIQKKKYKQLLAKVSFFDPDVPSYDRKYQYSYEKLMPYVFFFKYLAKKPDGSEEKQKKQTNRLKVQLPDTIVFNDGDLPAMWFYTSENGQVFRSDSFNKRNIIQKFGEHCSPDELVSVIKKPCYRNQELVGNDVNIVSKSELDTVSSNLFQDKNQLTVLQRFVKSNGPKAYICRTVWRKDLNPYAWIVTNKLDYKDKSDAAEIKKYIIHMQTMNSCTIVESQKGKFVEETVPYLDNIARYFHIHLGVTFKEIIGDFIKDESGIWWLVNIRGFILDKYEIPINVKSITNYGDMLVETKKSGYADFLKQKEYYQKVKPCKYCEEIFPQHELTNKLTLKMILQTDKHLQNRGKTYNWLNRTDMKHIDTPMLYQEHKVCTSCFKLYVEIDKLITAECNFARLLGIPVTQDNKINLASATMLNGFYGTMNAPNQSKVNNFIDNPNDSQMPLNWEFNVEPETEVVIKNNLPLSSTSEQQNSSHDQIQNKLNKLCRYRFMVLINSIDSIPIEKEYEKTYYVEYIFLDIKEKYKIEISHAKQSDQDHQNFSVDINRMRVFYFFAMTRKSLNSFIHQNQHVTINLICDNLVIGQTQLELTDFLSEQVFRKEYFKIFNGKDLPLLKWGISATLGLAASGDQDVTRVNLREYHGIYLPKSIYYTCEPLPEEWIESIIKKVDADSNNMNNNKYPSLLMTKSFVTNKENPNLSYLSKTNRSAFYDLNNNNNNRSPKDITSRSQYHASSTSNNKQQQQQFQSPSRKVRQASSILDLLEESNFNHYNINSSSLLQNNNYINDQPYGKKVKIIMQNNKQQQQQQNSQRNSDNSFNNLNNSSHRSISHNPKQQQQSQQQQYYQNNNSKHLQTSSFHLNKSTIQNNKESKSQIIKENNFMESKNDDNNNIMYGIIQDNQQMLNNLLKNEIFNYSKDISHTDSNTKLPYKKLIYWK